MSRIKIGITDHAPPSSKVEREAFGPYAEFVFLNSKNEKDFNPKVLRKVLRRLDALLVWGSGISEKTVHFLE